MNVKTLGLPLATKAGTRMRGLRMLTKQFPGRYVALSPDGAVVAIAASLRAAEHKATQAGVSRPVLLRVPKVSG